MIFKNVNLQKLHSLLKKKNQKGSLESQTCQLTPTHFHGPTKGGNSEEH